MEEQPRKLRNKLEIGPASIEEARLRGRIKAKHAAPLWGLTRDFLSRKCAAGEITEASKKGRDWFVTPKAMDAYFGETKLKKKSRQ